MGAGLHLKVNRINVRKLIFIKYILFKTLHKFVNTIRKKCKQNRIKWAFFHGILQLLELISKWQLSHVSLKSLKWIMYQNQKS